MKTLIHHMISNPAKQEEYYQALVERSSQYAGIFYAGVKTTGIFCISTCRARKPKKENVIFFSTARQALQYGFRPCRVCRPTENAGSPPEEIRHLLSIITDNPGTKLRDQDIRKLGYAPERIRRWFKTNMDITFQGYQRMIRLNTAYEELRQGESVTHSALEAGYESLSGFGYAYRNTFQNNPSEAENMNILFLERFTTPLGPMYACAGDAGLSLLEFTDRRMLESEFADLSKRLKARIIQSTHPILDQTRSELEEYFDGKRTEFTVPLNAPGTPFQQDVWSVLQNIPYGGTRSYKEQALALGKPNAVRAVARANGMNRIAIIIPCHRVIGSNGELTGYAGGLPRKRWLLDHEQLSQNEGQLPIFQKSLY